MTEDERTEDGGKWKIEQCSVGPETAIIIGEKAELPKPVLKCKLDLISFESELAEANC